MAHVDIILPLYNKAPYVARAIRSIRHQTVTDWRLIVVDDGSTDTGPDIVIDIAREDDRIDLIRQQNAGPGPARNAGLARVGADFVAFLDADDEWYPWHLRNTLDALHQNPDAALAASLYYHWPSRRGSVNFWAHRNVRPGKYHVQPSDDPIWVHRQITVILPWNTVARTAAIRKYGGFPPYRFSEDTILAYRLVFGETFIIVAPPAVRYHTECSGLAFVDLVQPIPAFLNEPDLVLDYCPPEKRDLIRKVLDHSAMYKIQRLAYFGRKRDSLRLLERYPGAKAYRREYRRYLRLLIRPYCWTRLKRAVGPPVRAWLKSCSHRLRPPGSTRPSDDAPPMPDEQAASGLEPPPAP